MKCALAAEQLVQDGAERKDVRTVIRGQPAHLLRRHVTHGSEHEARRGLRRCEGGNAGDGGWGRIHQLRQAEIENLHRPISGDEDVFGLQVAMDDSASVRGGKTVHDLVCQLDDLPHRQPTQLDSLAKRAPGQQLGHDECEPAVRTNIIEGDDIGVVEGGCCLRFLLEARNPVSIVRNRLRQDLDGDVTVQSAVASTIDLVPAERLICGDILYLDGSAGVTQWSRVT